jgi:four helix bundle protein
MSNTRTHFENLRVYKLAEKLADEVWHVVLSWDYFPRETVGKQIVRAADSVGANIAEGTGRGSFQDNRRFVRMARGSLHETRYWLRRSHSRGLLTEEAVRKIRPIIDELSPKLNAYLRSIGIVSEPSPRTGDDGQLTTDNGRLVDAAKHEVGP